MGGVSPETCWASYKYEIKILIHCCILLDFLCELYYDARIHEHQVSRFNFLHQCMPSVAQPERLAILRNTKLDIHQRIRLLLFAIITNFLYQPIFRHCLEIICRTIEKSGVGFPPETKDFSTQAPERLWCQFVLPKVTAFSFSRGIMLGREADCSTLTAKLKNTWSYTVTPPYSSVVCISLSTRKT